MEQLLTFGDIFKIGGIEFVYLGGDADTTYAAKILSIEETVKLQNIEARKSGTHADLVDSPVFSFVILTTDDFESRAAHLRNPTVSMHSRQYATLNEGDCENLKKEILEGPTPQVLKDIVSKS